MAKREFPLIEWTCPECHKSMMVKSGTRRELCPECMKKRLRMRRLSDEARYRQYRVEEYGLSAPRITVQDVLTFQKKHGISSYGKAVAIMEGF